MLSIFLKQYPKVHETSKLFCYKKRFLELMKKKRRKGVFLPFYFVDNFNILIFFKPKPHFPYRWQIKRLETKVWWFSFVFFQVFFVTQRTKFFCFLFELFWGCVLKVYFSFLFDKKRIKSVNKNEKNLDPTLGICKNFQESAKKFCDGPGFEPRHLVWKTNFF